jgi:spore germination protein YaaH
MIDAAAISVDVNKAVTFVRAEALERAREFVEGFAPTKNARGYSDGTIRPDERVKLIMTVADWLLNDQAAITRAVEETAAALDAYGYDSAASYVRRRIEA